MDTFDEKNQSCKISRYCTFNHLFFWGGRCPSFSYYAFLIQTLGGGQGFSAFL